MQNSSAHLTIHLTNGDIISTDMFSEIKSHKKRISCVRDAIIEGNFIAGMYTTRLGAMRQAQTIVMYDQVVGISAPINKER